MKFSSTEVANLFSLEESVFYLAMMEGEVVATLEASVAERPNVAVEFVNEKFNEFGINYLGRIKVLHKDEKPERSFSIKIPGELTYDPAGITGNPHASERIGGDCFSTQLAVTVAQVHAFIFGCPEATIFDIQRETLSIINEHHERIWLHDWMT